MTFEEITYPLCKGFRVRCTDWPDDAYIFRIMEHDQHRPEWQEDGLPQDENGNDIDYAPRGIYQEDGLEVMAVTIIENIDNDWEIYNPRRQKGGV